MLHQHQHEVPVVKRRSPPGALLYIEARRWEAAEVLLRGSLQKSHVLLGFTCSHCFIYLFFFNSASLPCDGGASAPRNSSTAPLPKKTAHPRPLMRPPASCLYYEGCIPIERQERWDRLNLGDLWSLPWPKPSNAPLTESNNGHDQHLEFSPCKLRMIYGWRL